MRCIVLSEFQIFYEVDATNLKDADKTKRYLRTIGFIALYFGIVMVLYFFILELSLIVLFVLMMILPPVFIPSVAAYKITDDGIIDFKGRTIPIYPEYRFVANEERKFVSVFKGRRELFMLYTPEPMRVMRILERVSKIIRRKEEEAKEVEEKVEGESLEEAGEGEGGKVKGK